MMKIALSTLDQAWENKQENLIACTKLAEKAHENDVELLIFPEMTLTGFSLNTLDIAEESESSNSLHRFADIAKNHKMGVVAGLILKTNNEFQNCAVAFNRNGRQLCQYAKIHPFSITGENQYISGGTKLSVFKFENIRFGLTICYDLRFPLLWTALADKCDCIINIANWPAKRIEHWYVLLQARAIENQVYIIGINRIGTDGNGLQYTESSRAYGPDGTMLSSVVVDESLSIIEIEQSMVEKYQQEFPIRKDRRTTLYDNFIDTEIE
jgi:omega-amidase